jgi:hypothetical protein
MVHDKFQRCRQPSTKLRFVPRSRRVRVLLSAWVLKPQAAEDHTLDLLPHNLHHAVGVTVWPH